jgi:hypothetical protein
LGRQIRIEGVDRSADGSEAALMKDLSKLSKSDRGWLTFELSQMSDEAILHRSERLELWPASSEGVWVLLAIAPYLLVCQLKIANPELLRFGYGNGVLKVVRVVHERFVDEVLAQHASEANAEDEDE